MTSAKARINKSTDNKFAGNEGVITSVAQCPNAVPNTRQSCDVEKLKISDSTSGRSTEISRSMIKDLVPKEAPARLLTSLYRYDAVLELLSAYEKYSGACQISQEN